MGMLNAAIWLGAAIFCTLGVLPLVNSQKMMALLGHAYFPYMSGGIIELIVTRLFYWQITGAVIAWLHLVLEWLYLGRTPRRRWVALLTFLFSVSLFAGFWLHPKLTRLHRSQHALNVRPAEREVATRSFRFWDGVAQAVSVLMIGGVAVYFWRLTKTEDAPRFVTQVKFRG